jgi:hypothetical protein
MFFRSLPESTHSDSAPFEDPLKLHLRKCGAPPWEQHAIELFTSLGSVRDAC